MFNIQMRILTLQMRRHDVHVNHMFTFTKTQSVNL